MFCKKKTQAGIWTPRAFLLAAIAFSVYYNRTVVTDWMMDDAFVSFRYADNWARGFGPVYNPGEPPVEGYTNFLWVALLTVGARLGGDIVILSRVLGAAAGLLTLLLLFHARRFVRGLDGDTPVMAALFLATFCIFQPWPTSGMETTLFGLLLTFSVLLHFSTLEGSPTPRRLAGLGVILALTAMTRPEGLLAAGLILADQTLESLRKRRFQVCWVAGAFLVIFLPWFVWRWRYYDSFLPNTFYAKVGTTAAQVRRGKKYFWDMYVPARPLILPAALAVLAPWVWWRRYGRYFLLPLFLAAYTAYIILVGGDGLPAFRFFAPLAALLCLLASVGVRRIAHYRHLATMIALAIMGLNVYQMYTNRETYQHVRQGDYVQKKGTLVGKWLRARATANTVLATNTAGTIPYYSRLRTIDTLGLNDRHIAARETPQMGTGYAGHEKGDGAYVFSLKPDLIQFSSASGSERPSVEFIGDNELYRIETFKETYRLDEYTMEDGTPLFLYVRKDSPFAREDPDVLFEDFESGTYANWTVEGDCLGDAPSEGTLPDQRTLQGYEGRRLANSMHGGNKSRGRALSKPFIIRHNYIRFLAGGGYHPNENCINLLVDGKPVLSLTPKSGYILVPETWDVSSWLDKEAVIEIKDDTDYIRGFILVDQIVFSNKNTSVETVARQYSHARFGLLPWLLLGAGAWCTAAIRRKTPLSLAEKLIPVVLLLTFFTLYRTGWVCDDAYISMRTVDNFTGGYGLTWNVAERAQAYTHPLWMFLISAVYYFSHDAFLTLIVVTTVVSMIALCVAAWGVARTPAAAAAGLIVLMFSRAFTDFSTSGLENPMTHLLLALFMVVYLRRQWAPGVLSLLTLLAALLSLNRMDLVLLVAPAVGWVWLSLRSWKASLALIAGGMPLALWMLFSLFYYGFPFPNTAYAKLGAGVDALAMMQQSLNYYSHTLTKDPITLLVIVLGAGWPLLARNGKYGVLSMGIVLYLLYVVRIGGDFMGNRFFVAPLFLSVLILMRYAGSLSAVSLVPATAALVLVSCCVSHVPILSGRDFGNKWENPISRYGICNERQYYYHSTGLLHWTPERLMPTNGWGESIVDYAMLGRPLIRVYGMIGFQGYLGGPKVILVDQLALSDPLLARLPALSAQQLRIGHLERPIPEGYLETLMTGENRLQDKNLAAYYDKLQLVTRGPLLSWERLKTIWEMNLGKYEHLIDKQFYRRQLPDASALS